MPWHLNVWLSARHSSARARPLPSQSRSIPTPPSPFPWTPRTAKLLPEALKRKKVSPSTRRSRVCSMWMSHPVYLPLWHLTSPTQVQLWMQINRHHFHLMGDLSIVTNAQMVSWALTPFAWTRTSVLLIVGSTTTTGSTMVMMLYGLSGTEILAMTYFTALAPAHLLLDVPVVRCGDLKSLCQLENPIGLHWQKNYLLIDWLIDRAIALVVVICTFQNTLCVDSTKEGDREKKKASESLQIFYHNSWWPSSEIVQGLIYTVFF